MRWPYLRMREADNQGPRPWETGFWRRLPWHGLLALVLGLGCGIAALSIVLVTEGKPLNYWVIAGYQVQPTVLLSVIITVANMLLAYAFSTGLTIFWWTSFLTKTTLRDLHSIYQSGTGFLTILSRVPTFNSATVASFFMLSLLMDGPLFQRAISIATITQTPLKDLRVAISPSPLLVGSTGIMPDHQSSLGSQLYHPLFALILQAYNQRNPITIAKTDCEGTCDLDIVAAGWDIRCQNRTTPYQLMDRISYFDKETTIPQSQPMFTTNITYNQIVGSGIGVQHQIEISTMYKSTPGTKGTLQWRNCTMSEALVRYPVSITNATVKLRPMAPTENRTVHLISRGYESGGMSNTPSTLGGLARAVQAQYSANASLGWVGGWSVVSAADTVSSLYLRTPNITAMKTNDITWADPIDDAIAMLQELTLRTAVTTSSQVPELGGYATSGPAFLTATQPQVMFPNLTAVNRTLFQTTTARMTRPETIYRAHSDWLGGGFAVIVLACIAIIPTYRNWWKLPRNVSMSPLEIARAFDAPLLRNADPNGEVSDLLRASGSKSVRYEGGVAAPIEAAEQDQLSKELGITQPVRNASAFDAAANSTPIGLVPLRTRRQGDILFVERSESLDYRKF